MMPGKKKQLLLTSILLLQLVIPSQSLAKPQLKQQAKAQDKWTILFNQGWQAFSDADYSTATRDFRNALNLAENAKVNQPSRLKQTLLMLTRATLMDNDVAGTEDYYTRLKPLLRSSDHDLRTNAECMTELDDLADMYQSKGIVKNRLSFLEHALEIREATSSPYDSKCSDIMRILSNWYSSRAQYSRAIDLLEKLVSCEKSDFENLKDAKTIGTSGFLAFRDLSALGSNYLGTREYIKAEHVFKRLLANLPTSKEHDEWAANIYCQLAVMYWEQRYYSQAESFCRKAIIIDKNRTLPMKPMALFDPVTFDYLLLGSVLAQEGRNKEAEGYLRQSKELTKVRFGDYSDQLVFASEPLADFLSKHNHLSEAREINLMNKIMCQRAEQQGRCSTFTDEQIKHHCYIFRVHPLSETGFQNFKPSHFQ